MRRSLWLLLALLLSSVPNRAQTTVGGTATIGVSGAPTISVALTPPALTIATNSTQLFVLSLANDSTSAGANLALACTGSCGSISNSFARTGATITYTAPSTPNSAITLKATSVADPTRFTIVPITVTGTTPPAIVNFVNTPPFQAADVTNTFLITPTIGNSLIVPIAQASADTISGVQACTSPGVGCTSLTQACPSVGSCIGSTTPGGNSLQYFGVNLPPGLTAITVSNSAHSGTLDIAVLDVSGIGGLDVASVASNQTTATTTPTGPSLTPHNSGELLVGSISVTGSVNAVASPYLFGLMAAGDGFAYVINTSIAPSVPSYTSTSGTWSGFQAAYSLGTTPTVIRINMAPASANVQVNATQQFTATVTNDTSNAGVTFQLTGTSCSGATCGTLSSTTAPSGTAITYTAPSVTPGASASRVQEHSTVFSTNSGILPLTATGATHALCGIAVWNTASGSLVLTDSASQTYTVAITGSGTGDSAAMACTPNTASGVTSLNFSISGSSPTVMEVYGLEYAGVALTSPVDVSASAATSTTAMDSGTATTTTATDVLVGFGYNGASLSFTAGNDGQGDSYTLIDQRSSIGSMVEDFVATSSTHAYKATMTASVASGGRMFFVALKAAASGSAAVTLTAASAADPTKTVTSSITIGSAPVIGVSVNPTTQSIQAGSSSIPITCTVSNDPPNGGCSWTLSGVGTLSSPTSASGSPIQYTPPTTVSSTQTVTVTAAAVDDNTKTASATITVSQTGGGGGGGTGSSICNPNCPAFAGAGGVAQGAGAVAVGGRGGGVYNINDLTDNTHAGCTANVNGVTTGTCSLRDCVQDTANMGARNCIFRVTGRIIPQSRMQISKPNITVAGQTSPGGGVIEGGPMPNGACPSSSGCHGFFISTHDVIIRYMTYDGAVGAYGTAVCDHNTGSVGLEIASANNFNIIIDHNSHRWWGNKDFEVISNGPTTNAHDFTMQWNLGYEPCVDHHVVTEPDVNQGGSQRASVNQDWHHNLFINYDHRCPLMAVGQVRWVNNVCYNGIKETASFNWSVWGGIKADIIGSKWVDGPQSSYGVFNIVDMPGAFNNTSTSLDAADCAPSCDNASEQGFWPSYYLLNNQGHAGTNTGGSSIAATNSVNDAANMSMAAQVDKAEGATNPRAMPSSCGSNAPGTANCWFRSTPLSTETFPITADQVTNLDNVIVGTVGNSQHLDCLGNFVNNRDSQDSRVVAQYVARGPGDDWAGPNYKGPKNADGTPQIGVPAVIQGTACVESMNDGIPDQWKTRYGLSTSNPTLYKTTDPITKVTYLEDYLDGLVP